MRIGACVLRRTMCMLSIGAMKLRELVPYTGVRNPLDHFTLLGAPGIAGLSGSGTLAGLCMVSAARVFAPVDARKSSCLPCQ